MPKIDEAYEYTCLAPLFESLELLKWFEEGRKTGKVSEILAVAYKNGKFFVLIDKRGRRHPLALPSSPYVAANFLNRIGLGSFHGLKKKIDGADYFRVILWRKRLFFKVKGSEL